MSPNTFWSSERKLRLALAPKTIIRALLASILLGTLLTGSLVAQQQFTPNNLVVTRLQYDGNRFGSPLKYPYIFNNPNVSGVQGSIWIDQYTTTPFSARVNTLGLKGITSSFSSKSEGALLLSVDKMHLTYMGYQAGDGLQGVSNSYTPAANLNNNTHILYNREVALINADGTYSLQPQANAYSGDNPRAAITIDGTYFYMAGNSDSTTYNNFTTGPGTTIGARYVTLGSTTSIQLGKYIATDRPDETPKQHIKDNNFRGIGIFNGNLYTSKGSGGNGDDGLFQVGTGLPTGTNNTITLLFGYPATDPNTGNPSPITPFGFWFADPTTVYVADEGYPNVDTNGNLIPDPYAGLEKWVNTNGVWQLEYTLRAGLNLYQATTVTGYPAKTYTYGIRNLAGHDNHDGTVTLYAITAQYSTFSNGEPDPDKLVTITDLVGATTLPTSEQFITLQWSGVGEVFRGVAFTPGSN